MPSEFTDPECPQTVTPRASPVNRKLEEKESKVVKAEAPEVKSEDSFDFIVAGFPKCGTTTLLKAFGKHNQTDIHPTEQCAIASPKMPDNAVLRRLDDTIATLSVSPETKRSFKCPTAIYNHRAISRMEKHSPDTKFIVGVRHPVLMLQSFYNYRVTEIYNRGLADKIPSFEEVLARKRPWKGVSMDASRFELFLKQFGKTGMTGDELSELAGRPGYQLAVQPNKFKIFLYSVDQMEDQDEQRSNKFRGTLQKYLGLSQPLPSFGHENINHQVGSNGFKETIDICQDKYSEVRAQLIRQASKSSDWLRDQFIHSADVWVANEDHFVATLDSWSVDPCSRS